MMRNVLLVSVALSALALTGCDIYFGPSDNSRCGVFEPCGDDVWPDEPPPGAVGGDCFNDYECNAGCFCAADGAAQNDPDVPGTCVESGFCESPNDCPSGYTCQLDRATCAPESFEPPPPTGCELVDCAGGTVCDPATGQCVPVGDCVTDGDCGAGFECDAQGICQPIDCDSDEDCLAGCACDAGTGFCEETGFCMVDEDCVDYCDPDDPGCVMVCDQARSTCTFGQSSPGGTCGGPLVCAQAAPICPTGETAEVVDGCYTGACMAVAECTDTPLATCDRIQNPSQCINRPDCQPSYEGMDCTCGGLPCDCSNPNNQQACTCSEWVYSCESI